MTKIDNKNAIIRENLKEAIKSSGRKKKSWIAQKIGISYSTSWRPLNGSRNLKAETVAQIALLTGNPLTKFMGYGSELNKFSQAL